MCDFLEADSGRREKVAAKSHHVLKLPPAVTSELNREKDWDRRDVYADVLEEARLHFKSKNKRLAIEKLKELIVMSTKRNDFAATGASFILCALIEYYSRDYSAACEYLVQLVLMLANAM